MLCQVLTGGGSASISPLQPPAQQTPNNATREDSRCANDVHGIGFGWVVGASGALGAGPDGAWGISGVGTVGGGTFMGNGNATKGTFASAGIGATDRGGLGNYPSNQSVHSNLSLGGFAGAGTGMFVTNAGNSTTVAGPFTSWVASGGIWGLELDFSNGIFVLSGTVGKSVGLGFAQMQTNTFATVCK